ncbi:dihydrodipicolinate synthase family protein [Devosia sp. A8/3-2]|nr:dihydrodipicolinate synthase family protein [Devosia sp. A8/3-2]
MQKSDFHGVLPAITTKMTADQQVDLDGVKADVVFQIEGGVDAIVVCGSLGEASSLTVAEKLAIAKAAIEAAAGRVPVLLTIAEDSTSVGAALAAEAEKIGVEGLMVLPAMRYLADDREVVVHYRAIAAASNLPIIVYNNPRPMASTSPPKCSRRWPTSPNSSPSRNRPATRVASTKPSMRWVIGISC